LHRLTTARTADAILGHRGYWHGICVRANPTLTGMLEDTNLMASKNYEPLRVKLQEERQRVEELLRAETELRSVLSDTADQERYGNHPADEGGETFEKEKSLALQSNLEVIVEEIDHALHKIDNGTYGRCDECGNEIPYERLEARPQATLCIQCKGKVEHTQFVSHMEAAKNGV
jgi:RNA polymerase-binding protein DksA